MCMVSNIGDAWGKSVPDQYPWVQPWVYPNTPPPATKPSVSRDEFEKLRKEIQELKTLLIAAKKFDEATGQPDCEVDEKVELLRRLADLVGVDLEDVLTTTNQGDK